MGQEPFHFRIEARLAYIYSSVAHLCEFGKAPDAPRWRVRTGHVSAAGRRLAHNLLRRGVRRRHQVDRRPARRGLCDVSGVGGRTASHRHRCASRHIELGRVFHVGEVEAPPARMGTNQPQHTRPPARPGGTAVTAGRRHGRGAVDKSVQLVGASVGVDTVPHATHGTLALTAGAARNRARHRDQAVAAPAAAAPADRRGAAAADGRQLTVRVVDAGRPGAPRLEERGTRQQGGKGG
jgi:hypothetical protein